MPGLIRPAVPAAVASAAAFVVSAPLFVRRDLLGCGDGLDALGCVVATVYLGLLLALVVAAAAGAVVLRLLGVRRAELVALFAAAGVGASWVLVRALTDSRWSAAVAVAVAFFLGYVGFGALFTRAPVPLPVSVAYAAVAVVGAWFGLSQVGHGVDRQRFERREQEKVEQAPFQVFVPARLPPGYHLSSNDFLDIEGGYYELVYVHGDNTVVEVPPIVVRSFRVGPTFDPPRDCRWETPGRWDRVEPCPQVGTTPDGRPVWFRDYELSSTRAWFTRMGDTEVVVSTSDPSTAATHPAIVELMASLRPMSGEQLRRL